MDFPPSALPARDAVQRSLSEKIDHEIRDACECECPKKAFVETVWPRLRPEYGQMVDDLKSYFQKKVNEKRIAAVVEGRVKLVASIKKYIERRETYRIGLQQGPYKSLQEIFDDMHDLAGIRVIVDFPTQVDLVDQFIKDTFKPAKQPNIFSADRQVGQNWKPWFGAYKSSNHHVTVKEETGDDIEAYRNVIFEVQLTSLPEQLYNRLAHPFLYKKSVPISRKDEMVIDLSHGLSLCYSMCLLYMQGKLGDHERPSIENQDLRAAIRKVTLDVEPDRHNEDLEALSGMLPDLASCSGTQAPTRRVNPSSLKRRASFGATIPVETLLATLHSSPKECSSLKDLWLQMSSKLQYVTQDGMEYWEDQS